MILEVAFRVVKIFVKAMFDLRLPSLLRLRDKVYMRVSSSSRLYIITYYVKGVVVLNVCFVGV